LYVRFQFNVLSYYEPVNALCYAEREKSSVNLSRINYRMIIIMRIKTLCAVIVLLAFVSMGSSYADQKIKTKSNIKNDRVAPCCKF
jgi:hypothetical protein